MPLIDSTIHVFYVTADNLFGTYLQKGDLVEKRGVPSVADSDSPITNINRFVQADVSTFWALLVGIYFPSVTGQYLRQQHRYTAQTVTVTVILVQAPCNENNTQYTLQHTVQKHRAGSGTRTTVYETNGQTGSRTQHSLLRAHKDTYNGANERYRQHSTVQLRIAHNDTNDETYSQGRHLLMKTMVSTFARAQCSNPGHTRACMEPIVSTRIRTPHSWH